MKCVKLFLMGDDTHESSISQQAFMTLLAVDTGWLQYHQFVPATSPFASRRIRQGFKPELQRVRLFKSISCHLLAFCN